MQEDIIYKLKALQSIEPDEAWMAEKKGRLMERFSVYGVKNDIFVSSQDVYARQSKFDLRHLFPSGMAVSLTSLAVLLTGGMVTLGASQSSLPGESLYSVKRAGEQMALAVASDQDKPRLEIELAGKRLEELAQISQKSSDSDQHQKVEQLVSEYQSKVSSASDHLQQLSGTGADKDKVASVAKVVTQQSEKYSGVLATTTQSLPATIKTQVANQVADATITTEKTNISALMVMVDTKGAEDPEVAAKVNEAVTKAIEAGAGADAAVCASPTDAPDGAAETAPTAASAAQEKLNNNDLKGALQSAATIIEQGASAEAGNVAGAETTDTAAQPETEVPSGEQH